MHFNIVEYKKFNGKASHFTLQLTFRKLLSFGGIRKDYPWVSEKAMKLLWGEFCFLFFVCLLEPKEPYWQQI
jgi:hypothetical protein